MSEARKDKRSLLSLKIRYKSATLEDFIEHYSGDISRGGVFIKSKKPLSVGTLLKFEFMLEDQSPLIHGVGRVVWRRDPEQAGPGDPPGMGIKFIKMDPQCRSVVQGIVEERKGPGAFDRGEQPTATMAANSLKETSTNPDRTSVRHVSEFLASAMAEGGADASTTREAEAGAERAREASRTLAAEKREVMARGALRAGSLNPERPAARMTPGTASSAFGARAGAGLDAQQTLPNGFKQQGFDAEATIVNQAMDPALLEELRGALSKGKQVSTMAKTVPPRATPVVPSSPGLVDASLASLRPAPAPPMPAIPARGAAPTQPVAAQAAPSDDFRLEDETGPVDLVSLTPSASADALEPGVAEGANPLAELYDATTESGEAVAEATEREPKKAGRGLALGLVLLLLGGAGFGAWQMGLLGPVAQRAEATEREPQSAAQNALADGSAEDLSPDPEPETAAASATPEETQAAEREALGEEPEEELAVAALPYVIEIVTRPSGARVTANESMSTRTPGELRFDSKPSAVTLTIRKSGYRTARTIVDLGGFVTESDRHVLKLEQRLLRRRAAAPAKPAGEALDELATAAETAAAEAPAAEAVPKAPAASASASSGAAAEAKPEPTQAAPAAEAKPEPTQAAPAPKAVPAPSAAPAKPAAEAKPEPANETGAASVAP